MQSHALLFWSRSLLPLEHEFVLRHFGHSLQSLQPRIRLHLRRLGDTRRALSMNGGRIYLPRSFFEAGQPERVLKLEHPAVAGVFAHELLHQWQRLQGVAVTRKALLLHARALCLRHDPYTYCASDDGVAMLEIFRAASVEQQGQMWEDYVRAVVAGGSMSCMEQVRAFVAGAGESCGPEVTDSQG